MKAATDELQQIVAYYSQRFTLFTEEEFAAAPHPGKWSKKQVLGHLIDSAQNNLRRFICAQYESVPPHIVYDQNFWVQINHYQNMPQQHVITLWALINEQLCTVLRATPVEHYTSTCNTGNDIPQLRTLEWLASDYVKHLKHHINQIIPGSFDIIYL